jgi:hypothetical protein
MKNTAADRDFRFLPFLDAYQAIQKAFGDSVEIGYSTRTGLSPYTLMDVEQEAVRISCTTPAHRAAGSLSYV